MTKSRLFASLVLSTLSAGCNINLLGEVTRHKLESGQEIDRKIVQEIVPGTTTKREIDEWFKQPERTTTHPDGTEEYVYLYNGVIELTNEKILWAKATYKDERKRLRVLFFGNVVRAYAYTNSAIPEENRSRQVGSSEVLLKTTEGRVAFENDPNKVRLDVTKGLAAKVMVTEAGTLDVGVPADNATPLRMRVRDRFGSANPGTDFSTTAEGEQTEVAVKQGRVVVRSRTGCDTVDAGAQKQIEASGSDGAAAAADVRFPMIHYGFKATTPVVADAPVFDCVVDLLEDYPDTRIVIEGHSDDVGSEGFNLSLSNRRAEGIRKALVSNGIDASRLTTKGYGRRNPVASNKSEEGRASNRRVEFRIVAAR